jgi:hypothetical protein
VSDIVAPTSMLAALAKHLVSKEVIMILQANQRKDTAMYDQDYPEDYDPTDYEGEQYAEFVMSWVSGGGSASDADAAWDSGIAHNAGYASAPEGEEAPPYYMEMTPEEREADNVRFEMAMEFD